VSGFTASIQSYRTKTGTAFRVRWQDENGNHHSETLPGRGKEAKAIAEERRREIIMGRWYVPKPETLGKFITKKKPKGWLQRLEDRGVKPKSLASRRDALKAVGAIDGPLSEIYLHALNVADVEDAVLTLANRGSTAHARKALESLKLVLRDAKVRKFRFDEAILEIKPPRHTPKARSFLDWEQVLELSSFMPEFIRRIVPVAALTGLRQGELFDLREGDVVLSEREASERVSARVTGAPASRSESYLIVRSGKTVSAARKVILPATAVSLLREQLLARKHTEGGYVFPAPMRWAPGCMSDAESTTPASGAPGALLTERASCAPSRRRDSPAVGAAGRGSSPAWPVRATWRRSRTEMRDRAGKGWRKAVRRTYARIHTLSERSCIC
jgi:integrase